MSKLEISIDEKELAHILTSLQYRLASDTFIGLKDKKLIDSMRILTIKMHGALEDYNYSLKEEI